MPIYQDLSGYFDECQNCGECCHIPGVFLPEQIEPLAAAFNIPLRELFDKFLIVELCAPKEGVGHAFVLSPVKVDDKGKRHPSHFIDNEYTNIRNAQCIFRDQKKNACRIHKLKPFACELFVCPNMTKANQIALDKSFYFHKWKKSQGLIFEIIPELEPVYNEMVAAFSRVPIIYEKRNRMINVDIATILNGKPTQGAPIER